MKSARPATGRSLMAVLCFAVAFDFSLPACHAGPPQGNGGEEILAVVKGVTNPFTQFGLIQHFRRIPGVDDVHFNLLHGLADIKLKPGAQVSDDEIRRAIRSASYTPGDITRHSIPADSPVALGSGH